MLLVPLKTVELKKGQTSFKVFQDDIDLRGADAFNQYFKDKLDVKNGEWIEQ